jgi:hypothetical protein
MPREALAHRVRESIADQLETDPRFAAWRASVGDLFREGQAGEAMELCREFERSYQADLLAGTEPVLEGLHRERHAQEAAGSAGLMDERALRAARTIARVAAAITGES